MERRIHDIVTSDKFELFEKLFSEKFDRLHDNQQLILEQVKKTNGRVTKLEDETSLIRGITKNKAVMVLIFAAMSGTSISQLLPLIMRP